MTSPGGAETPMPKLVYRGAEADIFLGSWRSRKAIFKVRKRLPYRLEALDLEIRNQRTLREAEMLHRVKAAGVPSPYLYFLDAPGSTLVMEYVPGPRMKEAVGSLPNSEAMSLFRELGSDAARVHKAGIMHGDLTTSNVLVRDGRLVFIDFGLSVYSNRLEDHAVDMRLIKETITGAHPDLAPKALAALFEGYEAVAGERLHRATLGQLRAIERRGRYARVE